MGHKSTLRYALAFLENKKPEKNSVMFWSPRSCTKASVVVLRGTAIRIMRPKGLSISQKAWLGKNKLRLYSGGAQAWASVISMTRSHVFYITTPLHKHTHHPFVATQLKRRLNEWFTNANPSNLMIRSIFVSGTK